MNQTTYTILIGLLNATLTIAASGASFTPLGTLREDPKQSIATDVSADGTTVVGYSNIGLKFEAFRWTSEEGMVGLGVSTEGFDQSFANGVSGDGSVIVGGVSDSVTFDQEAFRWTGESGLVRLGDFEGGNLGSESNGISGDGMVIVGRGSPPLQSIGFIWTSESGLVDIGDLPGGVTQSNAYDASADGSVIVGESFINNGIVAFRWTSEGMVGLGDLPGSHVSSAAKSVTPDGNVIAGYGQSEPGKEAMRWTEATGMVGLGFLGEGGFRTSEAHDVSADGRIVVGESISPNTFNGVEAFIWDEVGGMRSLKSELEAVYGLDLSNWDLESATGISDDGTVIVGKGNLRSGDFHQEAWMAVIEPGQPPVVISSSLEFAGPLKRQIVSMPEATYAGVEIDDLMRGSFRFGVTDEEAEFEAPGTYGFTGSAYFGTLLGNGIETTTENTSSPVQIHFLENFVPGEEDLEIINSLLGSSYPNGTPFDIAEIETLSVDGEKELEFVVTLLNTDLSFLDGSAYRPFPALEEAELAVYSVLETINGAEVYNVVGQITEAHPQVTEINITGINALGGNLEIDFRAQPGVRSWKLSKSDTLLDGFPEDLTELSTTRISEKAELPGAYSAEVDVSAMDPPYFLRIEK